MMTPERKTAIEAAGFTVTSVQDFLELSEAQNEELEMRIALRRLLSVLRKERRISQQKLARLAGTTQAIVSRAERAGEDISFDLTLRILFAAGATRQDIVDALCQSLATSAQIEAETAAYRAL